MNRRLVFAVAAVVIIGGVDKDLLERIGKAKKDSYYRKHGQEVPKGLFSRGVDKKTDRGILPS